MEGEEGGLGGWGGHFGGAGGYALEEGFLLGSLVSLLFLYWTSGSRCLSLDCWLGGRCYRARLRDVRRESAPRWFLLQIADVRTISLPAVMLERCAESRALSSRKLVLCNGQM